jgi:hypothetical protein
LYQYISLKQLWDIRWSVAQSLECRTMKS